ncbi:MAG: hypothetical protein DLM54_05640 [Acidimicrobiales bacterium]|nr:MAG: hypothetical protein DLM54_05640 [Acidimicrobiales bacterium]
MTVPMGAGPAPASVDVSLIGPPTTVDGVAAVEKVGAGGAEVQTTASAFASRAWPGVGLSTIGVPGMRVRRSTGLTVLGGLGSMGPSGLRLLTTYADDPSDVIAISWAFSPAGIGVPTEPVAMSTATTDVLFTATAVTLLAATSRAPPAMGTSVPTVLVARSTIWMPSASPMIRRVPSGVTASESGTPLVARVNRSGWPAAVENACTSPGMKMATKKIVPAGFRTTSSTEPGAGTTACGVPPGRVTGRTPRKKPAGGKSVEPPTYAALWSGATAIAGGAGVVTSSRAATVLVFRSSLTIASSVAT